MKTELVQRFVWGVPVYRQRFSLVASRPATERLIAWIIISKFGDHLPFYRQAGIFERQGLHLDRGTLGNWTGRACFHLMPVMPALC
ncbi:transposase [Paracoccus sp. SSJ]|uniref:IS66 family transposase n=1 Tax=Paracoccus sp. SSJ TaxID=3050636 RepID=UPI002550FFB6|nr:transposase [Paracoccus sp. SSJ]MDK8875516.1 transposase [Paracoccus sp. SSJ]